MKNLLTNVGSFATAKLQAKRRSLLAIIAIAMITVIGFSFAACDDGSKDDKDDEDDKGRGGTFTLTDIPPEYNGKYVYFIVNKNVYDDDSAWGSTDEDGWVYHWPRISNGRVSIPLWTNDPDNPAGFKRFTRTVTVSCNADILPEDGINTTYLEHFEFYSVSFTNGSAAKSWNDIDKLGY